LTLDEKQRDPWREMRREALKIGKTEGEWGKFYRLEEGFARLRPGWATTVHKSQGSTYRKVFLGQNNILERAKHDHELAGMLLYVGYSRASEGLYLS
jgi:exodeoxyribonuclease-5